MWHQLKSWLASSVWQSDEMATFFEYGTLADVDTYIQCLLDAPSELNSSSTWWTLSTNSSSLLRCQTPSRSIIH